MGAAAVVVVVGVHLSCGDDPECCRGFSEGLCWWEGIILSLPRRRDLLPANLTSCRARWKLALPWCSTLTECRVTTTSQHLT
jgi:hypothetical protein